MNEIAIFNRNGNNDVSMTTVEIAERTGKRHDHVMRDAKKILVELYGEKGAPRFGASYISEQNKELPCYCLPKREILVLVSGYSIKLRAAIIDRLEELERGNAKTKLPQTYSEALRLAADQQEKIEAANRRIAEADQLLLEYETQIASFQLISASAGSLGLQVAAKELGLRPNLFIQFLVTDKFLFRRSGNLWPYQDRINKGLFEVKRVSLNNIVTDKTLITAKGIQYFSVLIELGLLPEYLFADLDESIE